MDSASFVEHVPADRPFVFGAALLLIVLALGGRLLESRPAGRRLHAWLHGAETGLLAALLLSMITLSFLQIVLRNLAQSGFVWIDPLLRHLVLWVGFLGGALASRTGRHINIDALSRWLPPRWGAVVAVATNLLAAVTCLLLANAGLKMVRDEALAGTRGFLDLPIWVLQSIIPASLLLMSLRFLGHGLRARREHGLPPGLGDEPGGVS